MKKNLPNKNLNTAYYSLQNSAGFTLVEVLLVTFISGLVFVAIYLLYAGTIKHDVESRYEIIASNLAQEGIEIIRNKRDEIILAGDEINDSGEWANTSGADCYPLYSGNPGAGQCKIAGMETGLGNIGNDGSIYYNCSGACPANQKTPFGRVCKIEESDSDGDTFEDTLKVTCTVSWKSFVNPDIVRSVEAVSVLTDWDKD